MNFKQVWLAVFMAASFFFSALPAQHAQADTATVVRPGETLIGIASRHRVTVASIMQANGLPSPDRIFVGQHLRIPTDQRAPDLSSSFAFASSSSSSAASSSGSRRSSAPRRVATPPQRVAGSVSAAQAPPQAPAQTGGAAATMAGQHVVGAGENLFRIALRYGTTTSALAAANGLASVDQIFVGQRLRVPTSSGAGAGGAAVGGSGSAPSVVPAPSSSCVIVIDLSDQRLYAYQGYDLVQAFVVSTGSAQTPTPIGNFRVYNRLVSQDMYGPGYYAPGVPWVQYFTGAYALHGTYWHDSFGVPVSHGCINMRTPDAAWLFDWAEQGTEVRVQY